MKEKELLEKGFIKTDERQFVKRISETEFHIYDKEENGDLFNDTVDIKDYGEKEIESYVSGYYDDLEELKRLSIGSGATWQQIVAEIIAEQSEHDL